MGRESDRKARRNTDAGSSPHSGMFLPVSYQCRPSYGVRTAPVCNRMHQHLCGWQKAQILAAITLSEHTEINTSPVPNNPYGFCGRKTPSKKKKKHRDIVSGRWYESLPALYITPSTRQTQCPPSVQLVFRCNGHHQQAGGLTLHSDYNS